MPVYEAFCIKLLILECHVLRSIKNKLSELTNRLSWVDQFLYPSTQVLVKVKIQKWVSVVNKARRKIQIDSYLK